MTLTLIVLGITVLFLIVYDILIALTEGLDATISWVGWKLMQKYPVIAFALGFVMGHIIWVQHGA